MDETPREAVTLTVRLTLHEEGDCADAMAALWEEMRRVQKHMATVRASPKITPAALRAGQAGVTEYPLQRSDGRRCVVVRHAEVDSYADGLEWLDNQAKVRRQGDERERLAVIEEWRAYPRTAEGKP